MRRSPAKSRGATQHRCPPALPFGPHNSHFCLETKVTGLPLSNNKTSSSLRPNGRVLLLNVPFSLSEGGRSCRETTSHETSWTRPLSVSQPGLKMARAGGESLPNSALPHRPRSGRRGAASRGGASERETEPSQAPVRTAREGKERSGPAQQQRRCHPPHCPERHKMAAARPNQRSAPVRTRPLPNLGAPRAPDGSIRHSAPTAPLPGVGPPGLYKRERSGHVLLSAGGRGGAGGGCVGGGGLQRARWGSGAQHSHRAAPRCSCPPVPL